ncbi:hypothetical protein EY05_14925, partial [Staphylococcus aureus]
AWRILRTSRKCATPTPACGNRWSRSPPSASCPARSTSGRARWSPRTGARTAIRGVSSTSSRRG